MVTNRWFLGVDDISDAMMIRDTVFIAEQGCPVNIEHDKYDKTAMHLVLYADGAPVGCARMVPQETGFKLGRIAVLKEERGKHYGDLIMRLLLFKAFQMGAKEAHLGAQLHAADFYARFGFVRDGENYMEAGIEHVPMKVTADTVDYPSECHH
ncbi:MAG: GNAT family N-acetyltransferase [Eubacteriales bacterium]